MSWASLLSKVPDQYLKINGLFFLKRARLVFSSINRSTLCAEKKLHKHTWSLVMARSSCWFVFSCPTIFLNYLSTVRITTTLSISKKARALIMMHSEKDNCYHDNYSFVVQAKWSEVAKSGPKFDYQTHYSWATFKPLRWLSDGYGHSGNTP